MMYEVSSEFREAMFAEGSIHKIRGVITDIDGAETVIRDNIADNSVRIERQCTTDRDAFAIGQIYTGTVELSLLEMQEFRRDKLRNGTVRLEFGVEGQEEWLPLGVWTITDPQRDGDRIRIKAVDNTAKLDVPITDNTVGFIRMQTRMRMVTQLTGVEFAQTITELSELSGIDLEGNMVYGTKFCSTCRAEVIAMAQLMGCIVYIDRFGKIFFRKLGDNGYRNNIITADRRMSASLREYSYAIKGASSTDKYGNTTTLVEAGSDANTNAVMSIINNPYFGFTDATVTRSQLQRVVYNLRSIVESWVPGDIEYYGDPTLDLGDVVQIEGGVNGSSRTDFVITADFWQFRGPQTLTSAGASESGYSSSASTTSGSSAGGGASVIVMSAPTTVMLDIDFYGEALTERLTEIGELLIACSEETVVTVQITAVLRGRADGDAEIHVLLDGVMQTVYAAETVAASERRTVTLTAPLLLTSEVHSLTVEGQGSADIERITGALLGQGITEYLGDPTTEADYSYHEHTVDGYRGESLAPKIPKQLGGKDVQIIGGGSFEGLAVEYVAIPDGATAIE